MPSGTGCPGWRPGRRRCPAASGRPAGTAAPLAPGRCRSAASRPPPTATPSRRSGPGRLPDRPRRSPRHHPGSGPVRGSAAGLGGPSSRSDSRRTPGPRPALHPDRARALPGPPAAAPTSCRARCRSLRACRPPYPDLRDLRPRIRERSRQMSSSGGHRPTHWQRMKIRNGRRDPMTSTDAHQVISDRIAAGKLPGAVTLVARGDDVAVDAHRRDCLRRRPADAPRDHLPARLAHQAGGGRRHDDAGRRRRARAGPADRHRPAGNRRQAGAACGRRSARRHRPGEPPDHRSTTCSPIGSATA